MKLRMEEISVRVEKGDVIIEQSNSTDANPDTIIVNPGQIDLLIKWLRKAKEEAEKQDN